MSIAVRRAKHATVPAVPPSPELVAARHEIERLRARLGNCEKAYLGWRHRAVTAETVLANLPAALANPDALIRRLFSEAETAKVQNAELRAQLAQLQRAPETEDGVK